MTGQARVVGIGVSPLDFKPLFGQEVLTPKLGFFTWFIIM